MKRQFKTFIGILIFTLISCKITDTCNQKLGKTFETITLVGVEKQLDSESVLLNLSLNTLDTLPSAYFEDFKIFQNNVDPYGVAIENSAVNILNITATNTMMDITISDQILEIDQEYSELFILLQFKDRRKYIDCIHSGGNDKYMLKLQGKIRNISVTKFEIENFSWEEDYIPGSF